MPSLKYEDLEDHVRCLRIMVTFSYNSRTSCALFVITEICGLAILDQELFISRRQSPNIEVYDSTTFDFKRQMKVDGTRDPEHIVSCSIINCLYAFDQGQLAILRIDPTNGNQTKICIVPEGGRLSIASDTHVILNIDSEAKLREYTIDGSLVREINFGWRTSIKEAWHAVRLSNNLFVVCHSNNDDLLHRVCLISIKENTGTVKGTYEVKMQAKFGKKAQRID